MRVPDDDELGSSATDEHTENPDQSDSEINSSENEDEVGPLHKVDDYMSHYVIKNQQEFEKNTPDEFRKVVERLFNFSKGVIFRVIKQEGLVDEVTNHTPQVMEFIRHRNATILSSDDITFIQNKKDTYLGQSRSSSANNKSKTPLSLQKLSLSTIVVIFIFIGYSIFEQLLNSNALNSNKNNFSLANISFKAVQDFQICAFLLRNLILLNNPNYTNYQNMTYSDFLNFNFKI